jgi:type II secretory pathway pseudopilin PulG
MEGKMKQSIFCRIAKWALGIGVASIIIMFASLLLGESFAAVLLRWFGILALLSFLAGILFMIVNEIALALVAHKTSTALVGHETAPSLPQKQTMYGRIVEWVMWLSLVPIIVFCLGFCGTGYFACKINQQEWLFMLVLLGFPAIIVLAVIHKILVGRLPRLFIGYVLLMIFLFLIFVSVPNLKFTMEKKRQYEALNNLRQIYAFQEQYKAKNGKYARTFKELGWKPTRIIGYAYFLSPQESMNNSCRSCTHELPAGTIPNVADDSFIIVAIANLDCDPVLDVWSVTSQKQLTNDIDDTRDRDSDKNENRFDAPAFKPEDYD